MSAEQIWSGWYQSWSDDRSGKLEDKESSAIKNNKECL